MQGVLKYFFKVYSQSCATVTSIHLQNFLSTPNRKAFLLSPKLETLALPCSETSPAPPVPHPHTQLITRALAPAPPAQPGPDVVSLTQRFAVTL